MWHLQQHSSFVPYLQADGATFTFRNVVYTSKSTQWYVTVHLSTVRYNVSASRAAFAFRSEDFLVWKTIRRNTGHSYTLISTLWAALSSRYIGFASREWGALDSGTVNVSTARTALSFGGEYFLTLSTTWQCTVY